ncbi:hypothetical protein [Methylibium sp. T29-B]|uniref:hypothetical protein n=1 Tax=Methylibium sp. T29-B TaxID=1437443 RepID=UPI001E41324E|nr:hypothetical protein [Methylibium sp. T29-B]
MLSTKPCPEGIEMLAMAPGALAAVERQAAVQQQAAAAQPAPAKPAKPVKAAKGGRSATADDVQQDVEQLSMSTLSFQDYVRDRMLKKREAALRGEALREERTEPTLNVAPMAPARAAAQATLYAQDLDDDDAVDAAVDAVQHRIASQQAATMPVLREQVVYGRQTQSATASPPILREAQADATMLSELRSMKG